MIRFLFVLALLSSAASAQSPTCHTAGGAVAAMGRNARELPATSATLMLFTQTGADSPAESSRLNAEAVAGVRSAIGALGIPADSVFTRGFSTNLQIDRETRDSSYVTTHALQVSTRRLDWVARIIDTVLVSPSAGVSAVSFSADGTERAYLDALKSATEVARTRAAALADAAGGRLGRLVSTSISGLNASHERIILDSPNSMSSVLRSATYIATPVVEVGAAVEMRYEFIPIP